MGLFWGSVWSSHWGRRSISTCSIHPDPGLRCLRNFSPLFNSGDVSDHARENLLVQLWPAGHAPACHSQMDQVPRILAQSPWTLVIVRNSKAQLWWNPVDRGDQHGGCAGRKTANTLLWLNVYQIQSQNLWLYRQLAVSYMSHGWGITNLSVQVAAVRKQKLAITPKRWDNRRCRR